MAKRKCWGCGTEKGLVFHADVKKVMCAACYNEYYGCTCHSHNGFILSRDSGQFEPKRRVLPRQQIELFP